MINVFNYDTVGISRLVTILFSITWYIQQSRIIIEITYFFKGMIESKTDVGTGTNIILDGITQGNIIFVLFQRNGREVEPQTQLTIVFFKKRYF